MRDMFPEHFTPTKEWFESLWKNSVVVLDTSVLLNLYRYSKATRQQVMELFEVIQDRLWIPNWAVLEFLKNRMGTISDQCRAYRKTKEKLDAFDELFGKPREHPFLSDDTLRAAREVFDSIRHELDAGAKEYDQLLAEDPILDQVAELLIGRIGEGFSEEELEGIYRQGASRFRRKTPPGYMDEEKGGSDRPDLKYGDLVIWEEIIRYAKSSEDSVIFVTDDQKEDWWLVHHGKTAGPRPELLREFRARSGTDFYMYRAAVFFDRAGQHFKEPVSESALDEIKQYADVYLENQLRKWSSEDFPIAFRGNKLSKKFRKDLVDSYLELRSQKVDLQERIAELREIQGTVRSVPEYQKLEGKIREMENLLLEVERIEMNIDVQLNDLSANSLRADLSDPSSVRKNWPHLVSGSSSDDNEQK